MREILYGCFLVSPYKALKTSNRRLPILSKLNFVTPGFKSIQLGLGLTSSGINLSEFGLDECSSVLLQNGIDPKKSNQFLLAIGILFSKSTINIDTAQIDFLANDELQALNNIRDSVYLASVGISVDDIRESVFNSSVNPNDSIRHSIARAIDICCLSKSYSESIYECIDGEIDADIASTVYSAMHHFIGGRVLPSICFAMSFAMESEPPLLYQTS